MSDSPKRFLRDVGWSFASIAVSAGIQFLLRVFLARHYHADDIGLYTIAFTFYSFGLVLAGFGVETALTKYVAERADPARTNLLATSGIGISFVIGIGFGLVLYSASPYIADSFFKMPELVVLLRTVSISFPFIALEKAVLGFLNGTRRMRLYAAINIVQNVLVIILTVLLAMASLAIEFAVVGLVLPMIAVSMLSLLYIRRNLMRPSLSACIPSVKVLLGFGLFVVLANGLGVIQTYLDGLLLGHFASNVEVGIYGVASTLALAVRLPSSAMAMVTSPMISAYWGKNETRSIEQLVDQAMKWSAIYAVSAAFVGYCLGRQLLTLFFGAEYASGSLAFQILVIGGVLGIVQSSVGGTLSQTAYVRLIYKFTGVTLALDAGLSVLLIPRLGLAGAALASSATLVVYSLVQFYYTQRRVRIRIDWPWFVRLFGVTAFTGTVTYVAAKVFDVYVTTALGTLVLAAIIVRYFLSEDERRVILGILHISRKGVR